ncbi:6267_t:CDS:1, partial [Funneliformis mosseae]
LTRLYQSAGSSLNIPAAIATLLLSGYPLASFALKNISIHF